MKRGAPASSGLEKALDLLGGDYEAWEVRAFFLGAQAATNVRLGPRPVRAYPIDCRSMLDDSVDDATVNLNVIMETWNELIDECRQEGVCLSDLSVSNPPSSSELAGVAERRAREIRWFFHGVDAGSDRRREFGAEGQDALRRLSEAGAFCEMYKLVLDEKRGQTQYDVSEAVVILGKVTIAVVKLIGDLVGAGALNSGTPPTR